MTTASRELVLARAFVSLADTLVDDYDVIDLLDRLVNYSVEMLAADAAGLVLADAHERLQVVASSNETADFMELMQLQADQGPCLDCYNTGAPVSAPDLTGPAAARRWPRFVAIISRRGDYAHTSAHALPLRLRGQTIGSLTLFHRAAGPLPAEDLALGQALADIATIAILQERAIRRGEVLTEQLQIALSNRTIIEQAKGVLAQYAGLGMNEAFMMLRNYARPRQLRLAELARQLVARELDPTVLAAAAVSEARRGRFGQIGRYHPPPQRN
jgi:transcriptional regulator with GAF, ATPase, and Fis domain